MSVSKEILSEVLREESQRLEAWRVRKAASQFPNTVMIEHREEELGMIKGLIEERAGISLEHKSTTSEPSETTSQGPKKLGQDIVRSLKRLRGFKNH